MSEFLSNTLPCVGTVIVIGRLFFQGISPNAEDSFFIIISEDEGASGHIS
jgi:hypothetical protein